jgi:hypothetical protein
MNRKVLVVTLVVIFSVILSYSFAVNPVRGNLSFSWRDYTDVYFNLNVQSPEAGVSYTYNMPLSISLNAEAVSGVALNWYGISFTYQIDYTSYQNIPTSPLYQSNLPFESPSENIDGSVSIFVGNLVSGQHTLTIEMYASYAFPGCGIENDSDTIAQFSFNIYNPAIEAQTSARTLVVPDVYPTIQDALSAANPGDTVYVKDGTYNLIGTIPQIGIDKPLSLVGEDSKNTIIYIDWSQETYEGGWGPYTPDTRDGITIGSGNVTVSGLTLTGPYGFMGFLETTYPTSR